MSRAKNRDQQDRAATRVFMKKNRLVQQYKFFLLAYSILFILSGVLVFWHFPVAGKRMVWRGDGLSQHLTALCYYARWGRAVLKSILSGQPAFPTFNLHMGYGSDLFTTLQYYVIGDPFSLPAVLVPQKHMLAFHDAMILVRMYLAGLCFDRYCRYMGHSNLTGNLCGTLVYVFCSFALFGMRHPYFLNAMIWFPLLLLGAERIFRGERGRLFTAAVFLSCISSFYFFYMLVVMIVIYAVWRAMDLCLFPALAVGKKGSAGADRPDTPAAAENADVLDSSSKSPAAAENADVLAGNAGCPEHAGVGKALAQMGRFALKFAGRAILGVAMGACFLLPVLLRFGQDPRASEETARGVFYALSYYKNLPEAFISFGTDATLDNWTCMGFGAVGLISVLLLFLNAEETVPAGRPDGEKDLSGGEKTLSIRSGDQVQTGRKAKRHTDLKAAFAGMLLLVALPFAGMALNGFSYPANRWTWAFAALAGYITAVMIPSLEGISFKKGVALAAGLAVYGAVLLIAGASDSALAEIVLGILTVLVVMGLGALEKGDRRTAGASGREPEKGDGQTAVASGREPEKGDGQTAVASGREPEKGYSLPCLMRSFILIGAVLLTELIHGYVDFVPGRMNSSIEEYHSERYIEAMKASDAAGIRALIGNDSFYRYSGRNLANNFSVLHDVSNTQYYWSLSDSGIEQFFTETGQGNGMVHLYDNLDNRTFPDEIAGVRYYIRSDGSLLPYGYTKCEGLHYDNREYFAEKEDDPLPVFAFSVYENQYALPLGFTTRNYISRETYEGLTIPRRQEALMQGVVLDTDETDQTEQVLQGTGLRELRLQEAGMPDSGLQGTGLPETGKQEEGSSALSASNDSDTSNASDTLDTSDVSWGSETSNASGTSDVSGFSDASNDWGIAGTLDTSEDSGQIVFTSEEIPFAFHVEEGIEVQTGKDGAVQILVNNPEADLVLETEDSAQREVSVLFTGVSYAAPAGGEESNEAGEAKAYSSTEPVKIQVKAKRDGHTVSTKKVEYTLEDNPWKTGRSDFLSCCGYAMDSLSELNLSFSRKGTYTFKELKVIGQPMENYPMQAEELRRYVLEDTDFHELPGSGATDRITGTVTLPESRILCIQIPRCRGLHAYVDGEERPLLKADTMFSALALAPGRHEIELRYTTPGLIPGAVISAIGFLLFLAETALAGGRKRKKDSAASLDENSD